MKDIHYGRNLKGIKSQLNKKLLDWIDSISCENTKSAIKKDAIVTGGSIASMLLGEPVNDYDIYLKTKESTLIVAKYYADLFNSLYYPAIKVFAIEKQKENIKGQLEDRIILETPSSGVSQSTDNLSNKQKAKKYRPIFISENAITLSGKIQIVTRFYGEPDKIHDNYDFVHATCYYDFKNKNLVTPVEALASLLSRTLIYKGSLYPIASVFRTKKFINRGWRITAGQQLKMMWKISELDLTDYKVIKEQLTGVDQAYLYQLIKSLSNIDKDKIDSTYVCSIIDRIFK